MPSKLVSVGSSPPRTPDDGGVQRRNSGLKPKASKENGRQAMDVEDGRSEQESCGTRHEEKRTGKLSEEDTQVEGTKFREKEH